MAVRVKICGIKDAETAAVAVAAGADALGFVFAESKRRITPEAAREIILGLPPFVSAVGVFVDAPQGLVREVAEFCRLDTVQLHGAESPEYCIEIGLKVIKAFGVRQKGVPIDGSVEGGLFFGKDLALIDAYRSVSAVLVDTSVPGLAGGTGRTFDWGLLCGKRFQAPLILAGGLTPENVTEAVRTVRPYAVDVSSGVETNGLKDAAKIQAFICRAKEVV
ncbi:MAG TPA: phosphoribosylanthranilate isomerase [Desulfotomaculum sp.]|nr:phosphoribosylanthranilate isomerase [Desulfotomaculum sp.]